MPEGEGHRRGIAARVGAWAFSTDSTRVGVLWLAVSLLFFYVAGALAMAVRAQLTWPGARVLDPGTYNSMFTLHGTFMIFFFAVVVYFGLGSIVVPRAIGVRQLAFPRLNALDFWLIVLGGLVLEAGALLGERPEAGWTSYTPLSLSEYSEGRGQDWWIWAVGIETLGGTLAGLNFAVTILRDRAPGMRLRQLPLVGWAFLLTSLLVVVAGPFLLTALGFLFLDRNFGTSFFLPTDAAATLLWQDLFWFYSHPATYIMLIPAFGLVTAIIARFAGRALSSRAWILAGAAAVTVLGFMVWWHHMFVSGMDLAPRVFAALASWAIAVPSGIIVLAWVLSMRGGRVRLTTPMLFALGLIVTFTLGGANGVAVAYIPFDVYVHDTYWVVAHLHYVIFGATVLGVFAGIYYWFPAALHRQLDETLGKWHFWGTLVGLNLTFFPMHFLGLAAMRRRVFDYDPSLATLNFVETVGMFLVAAAMALFLVNVVVTLRNAPRLERDPWAPIAPAAAPAQVPGRGRP